MRSLLVWIIPGVIAASGCAPPPQQPIAAASSPAHPAPAAVLDWRYPEGPNWGPECAKPPPSQQSPIDFTKTSSFITSPMTASVVTQGTFDAHDQNVVFGPAITIDPAPGTGQRSSYAPAGFHFHVPAEHQTSPRARLEMHVKTTDQLGNTAVFGILWREDPGPNGKPDPTLAAALQAISGHTSVDLSPILSNFTRAPFYSYLGSLTTPNCQTGIRWYVLQTPLLVAPTQLGEITSALARAGTPPANSRNPQPFQSNPPLTVHLVTPSPGG